MGNTRLLPENFYITGIPQTAERPKLFRPKELREYVFPEVGMIMYPLFWVKYTLFLLREGYNLSEQKYLFFWAKKNKNIESLNGVLYYSLISRFLKEEYDAEDVSVGKRWARWIFKKDWKDKIIEEIRKFVQNPNNFNSSAFVGKIFSSDFKSDCVNCNIDLARNCQSKFSTVINEFEDKEYRKNMRKSIGCFVDFIAELLYLNEDLNVEEGSVISPNIEFTRKVLLEESEDLKGDLIQLANTNLKFTVEEIVSLLNALQSNQKGTYFLRSLLLVSYFDPLNHHNRYIIERMRNILDLYRTTTDFKEGVLAKFKNINFNPEILAGLEESCFYWELNYFLADGEDISRDLLRNNPETVTSSEIAHYFSKGKNQSLENFKNFFQKFRDNKRRHYLESLIKTLNVGGGEKVAKFLATLLDGIEKSLDLSEVFVNLLLLEGTIEKETENLYSVTSLPKELTSATFYGIDPLIDWSRTMLRGLKNE